MIRTLIIFAAILAGMTALSWTSVKALQNSGAGGLLGLSSAPKLSASDEQAAQNAAVVVTINDQLQFVPREVTIKAGETILWRNDSFDFHTVTADPKLAVNAKHVQLPPGAETFNSDLITSGDVYQRAFPVAGTYKYFCIPHEATGMGGEIIVEP